MDNSYSKKESRDYEHKYLRDEIDTNKKMIFERALLIAGTALAATLLPKDAKGIELLGVPALGALAFNLWITVNRLRSNMRILAYIQLFHENENIFDWIGWENSLRIYRIWFKNCKNEVSSSETLHTLIKQYDDLSFYIPIRFLHIAIAFVISFFMSIRAWTICQSTTTLWNYLYLWLILLNVLSFIVFLIWVLKSEDLKTKDLLHGIQKSRFRWIAVFNSYENGCLKETLIDEAQRIRIDRVRNEPRSYPVVEQARR